METEEYCWHIHPRHRKLNLTVDDIIVLNELYYQSPKKDLESFEIDFMKIVHRTDRNIEDVIRSLMRLINANCIVRIGNTTEHMVNILHAERCMFGRELNPDREDKFYDDDEN